MRALIRDYSRGATRRGLSFSLDEPQFKNLTSSTCHYCGVCPERTRRPLRGCNEPYQFNGIDRINNDLGYELGNVVPCCFTCNSSKRAMSRGDFLSWIARVYSHSVVISTDIP